MVETRSQASAQKGKDIGNKVKVVDIDPDCESKHRERVTLAKLVEKGRKAAAREKTVAVQANDHEDSKDIEVSMVTYVDPGMNTKPRLQNGDKYKPGEINSYGLRQPKLSSIGRGGGLWEYKEVDGLSQAPKKAILETKIVTPQGGHFICLTKHTTDDEICSWPIQALVQIAIKVDSDEFPLDNEHATKCNPKVLRRLIMRFRDDIIQHDKAVTVTTRIKKTVGVFGISTKEWEIEAYDHDELRLILQEYMIRENIVDEKHELSEKSADEIRSYLYQFQDSMIDAEIAPFSVHVQFDYYKGNLGIALSDFRQKMEHKALLEAKESENGDDIMDGNTSLFTHNDVSHEGSKDNQAPQGLTNRKIMTSPKEQVIIHSESEDDDSMGSDDEKCSPNTNIDQDSVLEQVESKYCHMLSSETHDMLIQGWSAKVLLQFIKSRARSHELFLPFHLLKQCNPKILRRLVRDIRDELQNQQCDDVYESRVRVNSNLFCADTNKWELKAYDLQDIRTIYERFLEKTSIPTPSDFQSWTKEKFVKQLLKVRKKMRQAGNGSFQVHVKLECFEGNVEKELRDLVRKHDSSEKHDHFLLMGSTFNDKINQWSPGTLKKFIHMWNVKGKLLFRIENIERLPAQMLRGIVHQIRDEMHKEGKNDCLHVEDVYWSTVHPNTKQWEIESFSWEDQKIVLEKIAMKIDKSFEVDDMTQEECISCIMEMIEGATFQKEEFMIFHRMQHKLSITQNEIDAIFKPTTKDKEVHITLSKDTCRDDIRKWSSKVLVEMIRQLKPKMVPKEKYQLIRETTCHLREIVLRHLQDIQENQKDTSYISKDLRQGFFGSLTLDWEIQGYNQLELQDLLEQLRKSSLPPVKRSRGESLEELKREMRSWRDILKEKKAPQYFNLRTVPMVPAGRLESSHNSNAQSNVQKDEAAKFMHHKRANPGSQTETEMVIRTETKLAQTKTSIVAYSKYSKNDLIAMYAEKFDDVDDVQDIPEMNCIPSINRESTDIQIGSWPPKTRMEILQQAGVDYEGQDCVELFTSLCKLRNNMAPGKNIVALNPFYGFFGRSTPDSKLWSLSEIDIKRLYINHCSRQGVRVTLQFLDGCTKKEVMEEMQLIRALWHQDISYRFDLCIQIIQSGGMNESKTVIQDALTQIVRRIKAADVSRAKAFVGKKKKKIDHGIMEWVPEKTHHIMGLTADWEIRNLSKDEAIQELNYQCELLHRDIIPMDTLTQMEKEVLYEKLFEFRKIHKRIYQAMNLPPEDKKTQEDLLHESDNENMESEREEDTDDIEEETTNSDEYNTSPDTNSDTNDDETMSDSNANVITQDDSVDDSQDDESVPSTDDNHMDESSDNESQSSSSTSLENDKEETEFKLVTREKTKGSKKKNTSKEPNTATSLQEETPMEISSQHNRSEIDQSFWYLRAKMGVNTRSVHAPALLKKLVRVLRENDQSFQILPFDLDEPLTSDTIIVHEDQFPDTEAYIKDWVRGIMVTRSRKLCFSLRITTKKSFRSFKEDIYDIINKNDWFVNFDGVQSESVYLLGWMKGIHPRCHRKDLVKKFIEDRLPHLRNKIHVYFRGVWATDAEGEEAVTEALAVEGAYKERAMIMEELSKLHWNADYGDVIFVPMQSSRECTNEHIIKAYGQQNTYLKKTRSKTVFLEENCALGMKNGYPVFFADWIVGKTVNNVRFLQKAESYPNHSVRLIYHEDFEHLVEEAMANLFANVCKDFSMSIAVKILGPEEQHLQRLATYNRKTQYHKQCAKAIESSRIKETKIVKSHKPIVSGRTSTNKMSYASATNRNIEPTPQLSHTSNEVKESKMENRIKELEAQVAQKEFDEKKVTAQIQQCFQKEIEETKKGIEMKMKQDKEDTLAALAKSENKLEKKIDSKVAGFNDQLKSITKMLWENKTENESQSMVVERMEKNQSRLITALEALVPQVNNPKSQKPPISAVERGSCLGVAK